MKYDKIFIFILVHALILLSFIQNDLNAGFVAKYLMNYGYLSRTYEENANRRIGREDEAVEAVRKFQKFYGLNVTGKMEQETAALMNLSRCGVPDILDNANASKQLGRKGGFSWSLGETGKFSKQQFRKIIRKALAGWSKAANLKFKFKQNGADTRVSFQPITHNADGQSSSFSGALAHATMQPQFVHMNRDGFNWLLRRVDGQGYALLETVTHELGHNLGLGHSNGPDDVMFASSRNKDFTSVTLSATDKQRIKAIHGPPVKGRGGGRRRRRRRGGGRGKDRRRRKKKDKRKRKKREKGRRRRRRKKKKNANSKGNANGLCGLLLVLCGSSIQSVKSNRAGQQNASSMNVMKWIPGDNNHSVMSPEDNIDSLKRPGDDNNSLKRPGENNDSSWRPGAWRYL